MLFENSALRFYSE